ncbi:nucleotide exchange factor GrpE [Sphaerisporangium dianthi]|uniref:Nucleotide exchange factor GrpE n=1 Tax=Sphaerisporangium dianthi TaxID=1436120 RepID=A0ABV9CH72_9ACTN
MAPPPEEPREPAADGATPSAPSEGRPDAARELSRQVEELTRRVAALIEAAGREHERAAHREQVIDRLHAENQQLRHGLLQEALTPVRARLYRLHDTVAREAARWRGPAHPPAELAGPLFSAIAEEVAEVLGRTGAERAGVRAGDAYDPALHRPAGTSPVAEEADGTVVEVLSEAFTTGERVLRKASVVVGRATAPGDGTDTAVKAETDAAVKADAGPEADAGLKAGAGVRAEAGAAETTDARAEAGGDAGADPGVAEQEKPENTKKPKKPDKAGNGDGPGQQRGNRNDGKAGNARDGANGTAGRAGGGTEKGSE